MAAPTKEESRAYSRGYQAGKRRLERDLDNEQRERKRKERAERIFISILPAAMQVQGWSFGEEKINTTEQRVRLAVVWTKKAMTAWHEI